MGKGFTVKELLFGLPTPEGTRLHQGVVPITPVAIPGKVFGGIAKTVGKVAKFLAPKTPAGAAKLTLGAPVIAGALTVPAVKTLVKKTIDPREQFKRGEAIGGIIEDPSKLLPKDKPLVEKIKEIGKEAGIGAGAAAAVVGGGAALKKALQGSKKPAGSSFAVLPTETLPETTSALAPVLQQQEKAAPAPIPASLPTIKIMNKPSIDIKISTIGQKKRFINQQNLIRLRR